MVQLLKRYRITNVSKIPVVLPCGRQCLGIGESAMLVGQVTDQHRHLENLGRIRLEVEWPNIPKSKKKCCGGNKKKNRRR